LFSWFENNGFPPLRQIALTRDPDFGFGPGLFARRVEARIMSLCGQEFYHARHSESADL
jgi:hypothetical protein